ncbi:MAG TPA: mechanosensitive ion channel domain-containing protein [Bacteriovoracaceae bacterium]|nr:mechanosensitive ion channel domain-containing protein [Bacteriovoracaceae bacterium]
MSAEIFNELLRPDVYIPIFAVIVSYVVVLFLKNIVLARLERMAKRTTLKVDDMVVEALHKTKQVFIIGVALYIGFHFTPHPNKFERFFDGAFILILMFQLWIWGKEIINRWIYYTVAKKAGDPSVKTTLNFVGIILNLALISVLVLSTLANFGHDVSTIVAGLGIGGVAIALATKSLLEDLFSSLSIVLDKPFLVGDFISFGEWEGEVEYIGLKTTQIRSVNGELILIANSQMLASKIRNYKRLKERRVSFKLDVETAGIKVSDIPNLVKHSLSTFNNVKFDRANLVSFTTSSASFEMIYWAQTSKYKTYTQIHHDVLQKLMHDLEEKSLKASASARV